MNSYTKVGLFLPLFLSCGLAAAAGLRCEDVFPPETAVSTAAVPGKISPEDLVTVINQISVSTPLVVQIRLSQVPSLEAAIRFRASLILSGFTNVEDKGGGLFVLTATNSETRPLVYGFFNKFYHALPEIAFLTPGKTVGGEIAKPVVRAEPVTPPKAAPVRAARPLKPPPDLAKEIEVEREASITALFIPRTDVLVELIPESAQAAFFKTNFPQAATTEWPTLRFSASSTQVKDAVVNLVGLPASYKDDRTLSNFTLRTKFHIKPSRSVRFLGKSYAAGVEAEVDVGGFLLPMVEAASGWTGAKWVEMHFRSNSTKSLDENVAVFYAEILPSITTIEKRSYPQPMGDHVHIVAHKPESYVEAMKNRGYSERTVGTTLAVFHSVVEINMIFESVGRQGDGALTERFHNPSSPPLQSFLQRGKFPELFKFYEAIVGGQNLSIDRYGEQGTSLKKNNAGARWGSTYSDQNLWGIELRFENFRVANDYLPIEESTKQILDKQGFFFTDQEVQRLNALDQQGLLTKKLWFSLSPLENAQEFSDPGLRRLAEEVARRYEREFVTSDWSKTKYSSALLVLFNWSEHPLVQSSPALVQQVKTAQRAALEKLQRDGLTTVTVSNFLYDSGLKKAFGEMLRNGGSLIKPASDGGPASP